MFRMLHSIIILIAILVPIWSCSDDSEAVKGQETSRTRPNIILITVDTLRADHLGCYGYPLSTSPNIDRFAAQSLLYENCIAHAPSTASSCASLLSGFLPHETEVLENKSVASDDITLLSELLKGSGYMTHAVVSNWILNERRNLDQGFDLYEDTMDEREQNRNLPERNAENTTDKAIEVIGRSGGEPFFLWIHYQDPHGTYTPPPPFDSAFIDQETPLKELPINETNSGLNGIPKYQRIDENNDYHFYKSRYDGEISYLDSHIGRLIDYLISNNLFDNCLIVFTSDHGESLGEHDHYFSHGHNLDHCLLRVPLLIHHKTVSAGSRNDFVQHLDLVPTILDLIDVDAEIDFRGRNILVEHDSPAAIFSQRGEHLSSIIINGLKYIKGYNFTQLFDITSDPNEVKNLGKSDTFNDSASRLDKQLKRIQSENRLNVKEADKGPPLTEEELEILKALGYAE